MFHGTARDKARETVLIRERLESVSRNLTMLLRKEGHPSVAVLPALPLNIRDGIIRGTLSLKYCAQDAGLGKIGDNSLLISSRYGNRLALAAVVTEKEMPEFPGTPVVPLCDHCGLCSRACPTGALRDGKVDIARCRNLAHFAPGPLLTIVTGAMQWPLSAALISGLVNIFGNHVRISAACSACMISCPHFRKGER
jgi:epoxyqueuosine reductase